MMMLASDYGHTDFAIGQDHSNLMVWLRRPGSDANGAPPFVIDGLLQPQRWTSVDVILHAPRRLPHRRRRQEPADRTPPGRLTGRVEPRADRARRGTGSRAGCVAYDGNLPRSVVRQRSSVPRPTVRTVGTARPPVHSVSTVPQVPSQVLGVDPRNLSVYLRSGGCLCRPDMLACPFNRRRATRLPFVVAQDSLQ